MVINVDNGGVGVDIETESQQKKTKTLHDERWTNEVIEGLNISYILDQSGYNKIGPKGVHGGNKGKVSHLEGRLKVTVNNYSSQAIVPRFESRLQVDKQESEEADKECEDDLS